MKPAPFIFTLVTAWLCGTPAHAEEAARSHTEIIHEVDPYYSSSALYLYLEKPETAKQPESEGAIYKSLLKRSLKPSFYLFEASIYPMPILGVLTRKHLPETYADAQVDSQLNIIEVLTAGFEEPYALSVFGGNIARYGKRSDDSPNEGFMGVLFSTGRHHILNNELVDDPWYELEWKVKGERSVGTESLEWSFRLGGKWHDNGNIADAVYLGIRRDNTDLSASHLASLRANTGIDLFVGFDQSSGEITEERLILDKKIPLQLGQRQFALAFETGLIHTTKHKYSPPLIADNDLQFIFRPNIKF